MNPVSREKKSLTVKDTLIWANDYLKAGFKYENFRVSTELLLSDVLGLTKSELYFNYKKNISVRQYNKYKNFIEKLRKKYPVDYILGYSVFMGLKFKVNESTLIPRPETELLVENTLELIKDIKEPYILEIGSGSGNIAVSMSKFSGGWVVTVENSKAAFKVAKENINKHGVADKVELIQGSMFNPLPVGTKKSFDCLISNPPYITPADYEKLPVEVLNEPKGALVGGKDGLEYIDEILKIGPDYIKSGGKLCIEIGYDQKNKVEGLVKSRNFRHYEFIKDYNNIDRIIVATI